MALGLQGLHANNIIHRDIKIENILMSDLSVNSKVRLGDLGSAVLLQSPNDTTKFRIGTPGFIAPEIIMGVPYGFKVDVWSLGCLMHALLVALPPFWDEDRKTRNRKVCEEELDLDSNPFAARLTPACKDFLRMLLAKDPAQRPSIEQVFNAPWLRDAY